MARQSPIAEYLRNLLGRTDFLSEDQPPMIGRQSEEPIVPNPSQPEVPKAEFNTKEIIDQNTLKAMQEPRNSEQQQRGIDLQDVGNPGYWQSVSYGREIGGLKALNELAANGEGGEAMRALTNRIANARREQAGAAGIDLSSYGADATAYDVNQQLQSQKARDILEGMHGKYSKSSDEYYNEAYLKNVMAGYSPRQAQKFAANAAKMYQADRVTYLDNLYNSYGREGYVTTPEGNQIIAAISTENPMLANFYAQVYPNAKEAYSRQNALADKAMAQQDALSQLGLSHQYGQENMVLQALINDELKERDVDRNTRQSVKNADIAGKKYREQREIDAEYFERTQKYLKELQEKEPDKVQQWYDIGFKTAKLNGATDEEAQASAGEYVFAQAWGLLNSKGNNNSNGQKEYKMTETQQKLFNQSENLFNNAHSSHSDEDIEGFEEFLAEHGTEFDAGYYQRLKDMLLALKGYQRKKQNDDNGATMYFSQVQDVNVLKQMYPNENWDYYFERKGQKKS